MKNLFRTILVGIYLFFSPLGGHAQEIADSLIDKLNVSSSSKPTEVIYLQTSKGIYETGEDLWFKAYNFDAQTFSLSDRSRTLYLRMVGADGAVAWQERYPIVGAISVGHIYIDDKLPEGDYHLEASTTGSLYADSVGLSSGRKIKVVRTIANDQHRSEPKKVGVVFCMFPEGGYLVSGIASRLAFKATDSVGNPMEVDGQLYEDDQPLATIKSVHDGMGSILFTPMAGKRYRIELSGGGGVYDLPEIRDHGVVMRLVGRSEDELEFIVSQSSGAPSRDIYMVGQIRGMVCCVAKGMLRDHLKIKIPLREFAMQGIAEFTVFDSSLTPIVERLVYLHPDHNLKIEIAPDKESYGIRERATVRLKVTDHNGTPVRAHLGVSVFDKAYLNSSDPVNMLSYCYLSSQIRGKTCDPLYYFDEDNADREMALDLLLLTQGWRRYLWSYDSPLSEGGPFLTDGITGQQTTLRKSKAKGVNINSEQLIQLQGAGGKTAFVWSDSTGRFMISPDLMNDLRGSYLYLKPMLSDDFRPKLTIDDPFADIDSISRLKSDFAPFVNPDRVKREVVFRPSFSDSSLLVDDVVVVGRSRKPIRDKVMGHLDSLAQLYQGPWVCMHGFLENYRAGYSHLTSRSGSPIQCAIDSNDTINVRRKPVIGQSYNIVKYEPRFSDGVYILTDMTSVIYRGALYSNEELLRMNNMWRVKGYYAHREFYHADQTDIEASGVDFRNTLFWSPEVLTDENGEATVSFYCSDINTEFIIMAEGTNGQGAIGSSQSSFRSIKSKKY